MMHCAEGRRAPLQTHFRESLRDLAFGASTSVEQTLGNHASWPDDYDYELPEPAARSVDLLPRPRRQVPELAHALPECPVPGQAASYRRLRPTLPGPGSRVAPTTSVRGGEVTPPHLDQPAPGLGS